MTIVAPLRAMFRNPQTRSEACKILKDAAILANISSARGAFSQAKQADTNLVSLPVKVQDYINFQIG